MFSEINYDKPSMLRNCFPVKYNLPLNFILILNNDVYLKHTA